MFDFFILPLQLIHGKENSQMDGLLAAVAPKKCERSRSQDRLLFLLTQISGKLFLPEEYHPLLNEVVLTYYQSRGSVTAAMRTAMEILNSRIVDANLKTSFPGQQRTAAANLAVIRDKDLYLAHGGATFSYLFSKNEVSFFFDPVNNNRALGNSRATPVRFFQQKIQDADMLLFTSQPPEKWTPDVLKQGAGQTLDQVRRTLFQNAEPNLKACLTQVRNGKGMIHRLTPRKRFEFADPDSLPVETEPKTDLPQGIPVNAIPVYGQPITAEKEILFDGSIADLITPPQAGLPDNLILSDEKITPDMDNPEPSPGIHQTSEPIPFLSRWFKKPEKQPFPGPSLHHTAPAEGILSSLAAEPSAAEQEDIQEETPPEPPLPLKQRLALKWLWLKHMNQSLNLFFTSLTAKLFQSDEMYDNSLSSKNKVFVSIAIPLILAVVGGTVYFRVGRTERHQAFLEQSRQEVETARIAEEIKTQRTYLNQALIHLNEAEIYGMTDESRQLRDQIEGSLDSMEGITRTIFQPILVQQMQGASVITRMVTNMNEVYLLDSGLNQVIRLTLSSNTYQMDKSFDCSSGTKGAVTISNLADIVALPLNSPFGSTVLAIDQIGNLMYCIPGESPVITALAVPDNAWGGIADIDLGGSNLFVLDRLKENILSYRGNNQTFDQIPNMFFDNEKPPLGDVTAMSAYGNDVYMLHANSSMSLCSYRLGRDEKTKCTNISSYEDNRPGAEPVVPAIDNTHFIQMMTTEPPDPYLYILDTVGPAVYQFSLRQTFVQQIQSATNYDFRLPATDPTAFVVTPSRHIFLAFKNQLYVGIMPLP